MKVRFQICGRHSLLTGQHFVRISADGIDLAIVDDKTIGVGALPAGIRIRTESGMNDGNRRLIIRILQILKEGAQLPYQKHSFVDDGTAGT